jgi:hypothetical protein
MIKRASLTIFVMVGAMLLAIGYGRFVYPTDPLIVWCLLLFCWLCYRLHRRALATFGPRSPHPADLTRREEERDFPSPL